jgi:alcohol dehydrogenase class IV
MAEEGIRVLAASLPKVVSEPDNLEARGEALYGAWLAGTCLGQVGMALHHKLCHTLGGSFNLPHAETHTVVLPHATHYNRDAAVDAMDRIARALGGSDPAGALYDLAKRIGAPVALRDIGMPRDGLERATRLATENPYYNPRALTYDGILELLTAAWNGDRPGGRSQRAAA